jgi:hypothetical protein
VATATWGKRTLGYPGYEPGIVEGRFMVHAIYQKHPWTVIVEPDGHAELLVVVTVYEVCG